MTWTDEQTVVVLRYRDRDREVLELAEVDLVTGASEVLVQQPPGMSNAPTFALDLLGGPSVEAVEPPDPMDPRMVVGLSGAAVLATAAGIVVWRRRVQP